MADVSLPRRTAPVFDMPTTPLVNIEYPGPVASSSTSIQRAVANLGGLPRLSATLAKEGESGTVELNFRPERPFSHSVPGETVLPPSWVVLKVVKRRRKRRENARKGEPAGVYTVTPVGRVNKVVRFRAMADLQYEPINADTDPTVQLASALRHMDVDAIQKFRFPDPTEDFDGADLRLLPPPVFSRLTLPQIYAYRANPLSTVSTTSRPDGSEITRLVNRTKYKGELLNAIPFSTLPEDIPTGPPASSGQIDSKPGMERALIERLQELFEERPVWTRVALLNQLSRAERSRVQNTKTSLPFVCYTFSDGPFRESCIKYGYDPRYDRQARFYQRVMIRNMDNSRAYAKNIASGGPRPTQDQRDKDADESSHIFDGVAVHRNIGNYQLCDLKEPFLAEAVQNEEWVKEECKYRDGWWDSEYYEYIRQIMRRKFFALLNDGAQLPEEDFDDLKQYMRDYAEHLAKGGVDDDGEQQRLVSLKFKGKRVAKPRAKGLNESRLSATAEPEAFSEPLVPWQPDAEDSIMEEQSEA